MLRNQLVKHSEGKYSGSMLENLKDFVFLFQILQGTNLNSKPALKITFYTFYNLIGSHCKFTLTQLSLLHYFCLLDSKYSF